MVSNRGAVSLETGPFPFSKFTEAEYAIVGGHKTNDKKGLVPVCRQAGKSRKGPCLILRKITLFKTEETIACKRRR